MCFKSKPISWEYSSRVALLFGSNYPGTDHELNGCLNDLANVQRKLEPLGFQIRKITNNAVTRKRLKAEIAFAFAHALPGDVIYLHFSGHGTQVRDKNGDEIDGYDEALYLTDGVFTDDEFNALLKTIPVGVHVFVGLDCCFSGTATRCVACTPRFVPPKNIDKIRQIRVKPVISPAVASLKGVIVISGCEEYQTSADACINDVWQGAFTFYLMHTFEISLTYIKWFEKLRLYLPNKNFDQRPTIDGDETLFNNIVFTNNQDYAT